MDPITCLQRPDVAPPQIFISSTFEELLAEIRDQIRSELEEVNYHPVMSELGDFSYTPNRRVYDSTVDVVATCQIYILVIGSRYGSVHPEEQVSITELEYRAARAANLPVYVYVQQSVWEGYGAHCAGAIGPGGHSHWVDDPEVFAFIDRVAAGDARRCVPFSHTHEIVSDFKGQVANLLGGYLRFQAKAKDWLWTEQYTRDVERSSDLVWVLTPNFYWDYADPEFRRVVFDNVTHRKVSYFYLFRDSPNNQRRIDEMVRDYATEIGDAWQETIHYAAVPSDQFNWCTEQTLFNPGDPRSERGIVVDAMDGREKANKYNVELGRSKLIVFRQQFQRLWESYGVGNLELIGEDH